MATRRLTATSFDCYEDVVSKYPESVSVLNSLVKMGGNTGLCHVRHSINATKNLLEQLDDVRNLLDTSRAGIAERACHSSVDANISEDIDLLSNKNGLNIQVKGSILPCNSNTENLTATRTSPRLFDSIIFNFPHLGVEDEKAHTSLLGHIFYRYCTARSLISYANIKWLLIFYN